MALESVTLNAGTGGDSIAVDTVGSVQVPVSKLLFGGDGLDGGFAPGDGTNGLDVDVTRLPAITGTVEVTNDTGSPLPVSGSVTVSGTVEVTNDAGSALPVSGTVSITDLSAGEYETVAASQTAQVLGATGAAGDYLAGILVVPATTSPGAVTLLDNAVSIIVFAGGASSVSNLVPFFIPLGIKSVNGAFKITTGANVSAIAAGAFT